LTCGASAFLRSRPAARPGCHKLGRMSCLLPARRRPCSIRLRPDRALIYAESRRSCERRRSHPFWPRLAPASGSMSISITMTARQSSSTRARWGSRASCRSGRIAIPVLTFQGLAQDEEPRVRGGEAGSRRGLEMKRPKWLGDSRATKSDKLKKARRQTDQRMKQQDAQKKQRDDSEKKK